MRRTFVPASALLALMAGTVFSQGIPKYTTSQITPRQWQAYFDAVRATPGVKCDEKVQLQLLCHSVQLKYEWFFTKPENPAHPALVERHVVMGPRGYTVTSRGHFAGHRQAYEQWYREYEVWNRKNQEWVATQLDEARRYKPADWETQAVERVMYDLWAARELGQFDRTYAHLASAMKTEVSPAQWNERGARFREQAGPVIWRRMTGTRWYRELPGTANPGVYAEVTVAAAFEKIAAYESRLLFLQMEDGSFRLLREEERYGSTVSIVAAGDFEKASGPPPTFASAAVKPPAPALPAAQSPASRKPAPTGVQKAGAGIPTDGGGRISRARWEEYLAAVRAIPDVKCTRDNFRQLICQSGARATQWVFTVPGHTAHPAVVQQTMPGSAAGARRAKLGHYAGSREEFDLWYGLFGEIE